MREIQAVRSNLKPASGPAIAKFKKETKNTKKNLDAEFELVSGENSNESLTLSPISELSPTGEISKPMLTDPAFSASSVTSQLTTHTSDDIITSENLKQPLNPSSHGGSNEISNSKTSSLEAEITISFLKKTKTQLLSLSEIDPQSKKLLDTLVEMVIEILIQMQPEAKDTIEELISAKTPVVLACILLLLLVIAMQILLFNSAPRNSFGKPPPPT